jgi:hypothetical protein
MDLLELPDELIQSIMMSMDIREYCDFRLSCRILYKLSNDINESYKKRFRIIESPKFPEEYFIPFEDLSVYRCFVEKHGYEYGENAYHGSVFIYVKRMAAYGIYQIYYESRMVGSLMAKEIWQFGKLVRREVYELKYTNLIYSIDLRKEIITYKCNIMPGLDAISYYNYDVNGDILMTLDENIIKLRYLNSRIFVKDVCMVEFDNNKTTYLIDTPKNCQVIKVWMYPDYNISKISRNYDGIICDSYHKHPDITTYTHDEYIDIVDLTIEDVYFKSSLPQKK